MPYNGYLNYETWNCNMFLGLTPYYSWLGQYCQEENNPTYIGFVLWAKLQNKKTPDGVLWLDQKLDYPRLNESILEYKIDTFGL